jgi:hypothetical protein
MDSPRPYLIHRVHNNVVIKYLLGVRVGLSKLLYKVYIKFYEFKKKIPTVKNSDA